MRQAIPHRRDIDGLRAVAVLSVLFYHYDVPGFGGGLELGGLAPQVAQIESLVTQYQTRMQEYARYSAEVPALIPLWPR